MFLPRFVRPIPRGLLLLLASVSLAIGLAACGGGGSDDDKVSVQLDWTPNTNHIGIYVALARGWYEDAGIDVEVLPYTDAGNADTIVANGQADFGISFTPSVIFSRAAGLDLVSVAAVLQTSVTELAVLESSEIRRPRDFDGHTYAGFGLPFEEPQIKTVIRADGGKGEFETATLSTAAYEALYNKRADFTEIFTTWEGIEADLRGIKLRTFRYDDYGVPDNYGVVLVAKQGKIKERADIYRRFLEVTARGYEYAAQNPDEAAQAFIDYLPEGTFENPQLVTRSAQQLAKVFVEGGRWGNQREAMWSTYASWLIGQGVVVDAASKPVTQIPSSLYTNDLLDAAGARAE